MNTFPDTVVFDGIEDIPNRLARFGLMNPADFLAEMQERWEHQQAEGS
ncbi:MAG: hypothetical protein IPO08_21230 [Xanthomonadales bacterium]|jgi:hypothetical protein|nr:hypothetical protein [Xanthomonadales bacterium]